MKKITRSIKCKIMRLIDISFISLLFIVTFNERRLNQWKLFLIKTFKFNY